MTRSLIGLVALAVALLAAPGAQAQIFSATGSVAMNASLPETLSIAVTSGGTVNFTLNAGGVASGDVPVTIQTGWTLQPSRTSVQLIGYFDSPTAALTNGSGSDIPTSAVEGRMSTGLPASFTAFTQTSSVGPAGASLVLFQETITGVNKAKTRTDNLDLRINLTGVPQLPAGTYTGTLRIQATAF